MNDYHAAAEREQAQRMLQLKRKVTRLQSAESKADALEKKLSASQHDVRSLTPTALYVHWMPTDSGCCALCACAAGAQPTSRARRRS